MSMRKDDGAHHFLVLLQVRHVRNYDIDAEQLGFGEHHARVDDDNVIAKTQRHHVHAEFPQAAQGYCPK
jgi:hypothetical protein